MRGDTRDCGADAGGFQPTTFFGVVALVKELEKTGGFNEFTRARKSFEDFILGHKNLPSQITQKFGSGLKGYSRILKLYKLVLNNLQKNDEVADIEKAITADEELKFLQLALEEQVGFSHKDFSTDTKSATYINEAISMLVSCKYAVLICTAIQSLSTMRRTKKKGAWARHPTLSWPILIATRLIKII